MPTQLVQMCGEIYRLPTAQYRPLLNAILRGGCFKLSDYGAERLGAAVELTGMTDEDAIQALHDLDASEALE